MANKYNDMRNLNPALPGGNVKEHTVGATDLPSGTRAVVFNAAGTCDGLNSDGTAFAAYPVAAGIPLPFVPARITAMATATKCFVTY